MSTAAIIPYHLRPHKAIDRNLFIDILKKLDSYSKINLKNYKYVGLGGPFLEDFKTMHLEISIHQMDCIESETSAYRRQLFNNPYNCITFYNKTSTDYIASPDFTQNMNQIIWLDYARPPELNQQLLDIQLLGEKLTTLDIVKFTFNASIQSFFRANELGIDADNEEILRYLKDHPVFGLFLSDKIGVSEVVNFPGVIRSMATRAIRRGISNGGKNLTFNHIASFNYADGQLMTTVTGIVCAAGEFPAILQQSGLNNWTFYQPNAELIKGNVIAVPVMTVAERFEIDKHMPSGNLANLAGSLPFSYGIDNKEHKELIKGYTLYYKYLPYYSKVSY